MNFMDSQIIKFSILVSGAGRGGTNLLAALFREMSLVDFSELGEDRELFKKPLAPNYGCKLAVDNQGFFHVHEYMKKYPYLYVFFSLRHPIDNAMSKIVRGQASSDGGDTTMEEVAPDGVPDGAIKSIQLSFDLYKTLKEQYPDRVYGIRMEDLITDINFIAGYILQKLNASHVDIDTSEIDLMRSSRNKWHQKRYQGQVDTNQINLFENLDTAFEGYFSNNETLIHNFYEKLNDEIQLHKALTYD